MINTKAIKPEELENVTGGVRSSASNSRQQLIPMECPHCHWVFGADVSKSTLECEKCHKPIEIKG